jgi:hypothetical protein
MMLDRKYFPDEVAEIAARGTTAMEKGGIPKIVVLAAHVAAADALLGEVTTIGRLHPDFQNAARVLHAVAQLFLLVCATGPVSGGKPS